MSIPVTSRVERYVPLDDIAVRNEGGERIIDAYAATFGVRQEIKDGEGHYMEEIAATAFDRTIAQRSNRLQVLYNHGKTIYGTPSERFSMPYGVPLEVRPDGRGLFTSTKVSNTPLGDEVLELVQSGAVRGQSFAGAWVSTEAGQGERGGLPVKIRTEIAMREFGVTPFPAYVDASIIGVRNEAAEMLATLSTEEIVEHLLSLPSEQRSQLLEALTAPADPGTGDDDPADPRTEVGPTRTRGIRDRMLRELALGGIK